MTLSVGRGGLFGAGFLARASSFSVHFPFFVAIPTVASLTTLLNFKVNISDGIGEEAQTDNSRDKYLSTSGIIY